MQPKPSYLPDVFLKFSQQLLHFTAIPIFFFLFSILYRPFELDSTLNFQHGGFAFNIAIITSILFVVLLITRITLWGLRNATAFQRRSYFMWCISEIIISSLFVSLYVHLISGKLYTFIDIFPYSLAYLAGILIYPYIILFLFLESDIIAKYISNNENGEEKLRFYDEKHNLKFITQSKSLVYVESDENYCYIYYLDNGKLMKYHIRSSLKKIEEIVSPYGIVKCHRSFLINVNKIRSLTKDDGLIRAQMDIGGIEDIPVTPKYYKSIIDMM